MRNHITTVTRGVKTSDMSQKESRVGAVG
jgi:hypothetical protein